MFPLLLVKPHSRPFITKMALCITALYHGQLFWVALLVLLVRVFRGIALSIAPSIASHHVHYLSEYCLCVLPLRVAFVCCLRHVHPSRIASRIAPSIAPSITSRYVHRLWLSPIASSRYLSHVKWDI